MLHAHIFTFELTVQGAYAVVRATGELVLLQQDAFATPEWSLHVVAGAGVQRVLDLAGARGDLRWISEEQLAG